MIRKTREEIVNLIKQTDGRLFSITFKKRTTGGIRKLVARLGVTKGLTGEGQKFDPVAKGLVNVYDMQDGRRCFPIDGIIHATIDGKDYEAKLEKI